MTFQTGDKVKISDVHGYHGIDEGTIGEVTGIRVDQRIQVDGLYYNGKDEFSLGFPPECLEKVNVNLDIAYTTENVTVVPVGTPVDIRDNDNEISETYPWVGVIQGYESYGDVYFKDDELSESPDQEDDMPSREQVLESAVIFAKSIFEHYGQEHLDKKTAVSGFKAKVNFGFSTIMGNALDYEAD